MRVLIDILHPAHVHFFKNLIIEMHSRGHQVRILSRKKDVATALLDAYGFEHTVISTQRPGRGRLARELAKRIIETRRAIHDFQPDLIMGLMGPSIAIAGMTHRARTIVFYDNETTHRLNQIVARCADAWISPRGFKHDYGGKHLRYDGYHELAYLHPDRFTPDAERVRAHGIDPEKPYSLLRFVAWESIHDGGESGFNVESKHKAIEILSRMGPVYISSEKPLPPAFEQYRLNLPVEDIHHALGFATLVAGESSTMASEAACLGTHALFVSKSGRGVNDEQESRYGLVKNFNGGREREALAYLEELVAAGGENIKREAQQRRNHLLRDTVDVTRFLIDLTETGEPQTPMAPA
ncbi:MAG: DUF354 domain-containing protein [Pseudomonadota bacterium]